MDLNPFSGRKNRGPSARRLPEPSGWTTIVSWPDFTRNTSNTTDHTNFVPPYDYNPLEFQSYWRGNQLPGSGLTSDRPETYAEILPGYYDDKAFAAGNMTGGGLTTVETNRYMAVIYAAYDKYHEV